MKSRGFTLTEVMIGVGALSFLVYSGITVQKLLNNSTKVGERSQAAIALASNLRERLKYSNLCAESLGNTSTVNQNVNVANLTANNEQLEIRLPGLTAGVNGTENILRAGQVLPSQRLIINDVRMINVNNVGGNTFIGQLRVGIDTYENVPLKPFITGTIQFDLSGNSGTQRFLTCGGVNSDVSQQICENMGCQWSTSPVGCICKTISSLCPLGQYPIEFQPGGPICVALGGPCPSGQYLTQVGIGSQVCADLPTASPPGPPAPTPPGPPAPPTPTPTPPTPPSPAPTCTGGLLANSCCTGSPPTNSSGRRAVCCGIDTIGNSISPTWFTPPNVTLPNRLFFCGCGNSPVWFAGPLSGC